MDQGLGRLRADGLEGDPCSYPSTFFVLESSSSDNALAGLAATQVLRKVETDRRSEALWMGHWDMGMGMDGRNGYGWLVARQNGVQR